METTLSSDKICGELTRIDVEFAIVRSVLQRPAALLELDPRFRPDMMDDKIGCELIRAAKLQLARQPDRALGLEQIRDLNKTLFSLMPPSQLQREYLDSELNWVPDHNAGYWSKRIVELWSFDELTELAGFLQAQARSYRNNPAAPPVGELIEEHQNQIGRLRTELVASTEPTEIQPQLAELKAEMADGKLSRKVETGLLDVDRLTGGLPSGQLSTIAARPGAGKTAYGLQICRHNWKAGGNAVFFSVEQPWRDVVKRLACASGQVTFDQLESPGFEQSAEWARIESELSPYRSRIIDDGRMTAVDIASEIAIYHSVDPVDLVVIDYLQLLRAADRKLERHHQIRESVETLVEVAKRLDIPVLVLAQLNRKAEDMKGSPQMSWLGESASIEHNSNQVMFLMPGEKEGKIREVSLHVLKNRHGDTGVERLAFRGEHFTFAGYVADDANEVYFGDWAPPGGSVTEF